MAAVTATLNPSKLGELLLFYCATDQNINLSRLVPASNSNSIFTAPHKRGEKDTHHEGGRLGHGRPLHGTNPVRGTRPRENDGLILNPSCFGLVNWKSLLFVFGIRASDNVICVTSPEFRPINRSPVAASGSLAACGDGKTGWLYYISDPGVIAEYKLDPGVFTSFTATPDPNSSLCAYYNHLEGKRYCIYQKNSVLQWFSTPEEGMGTIINANNAKPDTPMAICTAGNSTYLFYCTNQSYLCVITYTNGRWGSSTVVTDAQQLAPSTRLSAAPTSDEDQICVYYIAKSDSTVFYEWTHIVNNA